MDGEFHISEPAAYTSVIVTGSGHLILDALLEVSGNMVVEPGGRVDHSQGIETGAQLEVLGTIHVQRGTEPGRINVTGFGLLGGHRSINSSVQGETYDPVTGEIVPGSQWTAGGSHGGIGGYYNAGNDPAEAYGVIERADQLGGGGGSELPTSYGSGGNGGGLVRISAGTLIVDGEIRADGGRSLGNCGYAYNRCGGGAGGGIQIEADVFAGSADGLISAAGGNSLCRGGGGGGGRIVVLADDLSGYAGGYAVHGGQSEQYSGDLSNRGSSGTIYLRPSRNDGGVLGDLRLANLDRDIDHGSPLRTELSEIGTIELSREGWLRHDGSLVMSLFVAEGVQIASNGRYDLTSGAELSVTLVGGTDLGLAGGGSFNVYQTSTLNLDHLVVNGGTFYTEESLEFADAAGVLLQGSGGRFYLRGESVLTIPAFDETNMQGGMFVVGGTSRLDIGSDAIRIGLELVKDGQFGGTSEPDQIGEMTVLPGGKVRHSTRVLSGVLLDVTGTLHVQRVGTAGQINVTDFGLLGGHRSSNSSVQGETYDPVTEEIVPGSELTAGGSHGGVGGFYLAGNDPAAAYGVIERADQLGGGGGSELSTSYGSGGNGGGLVRISAGTLIVDGEIRADGGRSLGNCGYAYNRCGGGAGGGIQIEADVFTGSADGLISAAGGNSLCRGGGGGGGRIVVLADDLSGYAGGYAVHGGQSEQDSGDLPNRGSSGTIYLRPSRNDGSVLGDLRLANLDRDIDHGSPLRTELSEISTIELSREGWLRYDGSLVTSFTVAEGVQIASSGRCDLTSGAELTITLVEGVDLDVASGGSFNVYQTSTLNLDRLVVNGGTFYTDIPLAFADAGGVRLNGTSTAGKIILRGISVFTIPSFDENNMQNGTFDIGATARLDVGSDELRVNNGLTLVKDGQFGGSGALDEIANLTVLPGGNIRHSVRFLDGLRLAVPGMLWIQRSQATIGRIDVTGYGLLGAGRGSTVPGIGTTRGETYDESVNIVPGSGGSSGGSHGGLGGTGGSPGPVGSTYGRVHEAIHLGGGGGCEYAPYNPGGNGGGLVSISAGTVIVDGEIRADGGVVNANCGFAYGRVGGGAGGSIAISAGTLQGSTDGRIVANGGNGACTPSGGGGGGRIVVFYDSLDFPYANFSVAGGLGAGPGSPGTVLVSDNASDPITSTSEPYIILSPSGALSFSVTLRDANSTPVEGSVGAWLDFNECPEISTCGGIHRNWPIVTPDSPSDATGRVTFSVRAGGCTQGEVAVRTPRGDIATVPVRSLDHNGGFIVNVTDFVGDECNDYNNDGVTDYNDWDFFGRYLGQTCITDAASYFTASIFTVPGPDSLFLGETIDVCSRVTNLVAEPALLDSVRIEVAGYGIANPWTPIHREFAIPVPASGGVDVCTEFTIPSDIPQHGCFRVNSYPTFPVASDISKTVAFSPGVPLANAAGSPPVNTRQKNTNSRKRGPCPPRPEDEVPCQDSTSLEAEIHAALLNAEPCLRQNFSCLDIDRMFQALFRNGVKCTKACPKGLCGQEGGANGREDCTSFHLCTDENGQLNCDNDATCYRERITFPPIDLPDGCNCASIAIHELLHLGFGNVFDRSADLDHGLICQASMSCFADLCGEWDYACAPGNRAPESCPPPVSFPDAKNYEPNLNTLPAQVHGANTLSTLSFDSTELEIPIGAALGPQLRLNVLAFIPDTWSYTISDTGLVAVPETIRVTVNHPQYLACADTGRVIVYAETLEGEYAGEAEMLVHRVGPLGDVDFSGAVSGADVGLLANWLISNAESSVNPDGVDVSNDNRADIVDLTMLADSVYGGRPLECLASGSLGPLDAAVSQEGDTTSVVLDSEEQMRGVYLKLVGAGTGSVASTLSPQFEVLTNAYRDTLWIIAADLDGDESFAGPVTFRVHGTYSSVAGVYASSDYGSGKIIGSGSVSVVVSQFAAMLRDDGGVAVNWYSSIPAEYDLMRQSATGSEAIKLNAEPIRGRGRLEFLDTSDELMMGGVYRYTLVMLGAERVQYGPIEIAIGDQVGPLAFALGPCVPNPTTGNTTLFFDVANRAIISISVYDVRGRLVADLLSGSQEPGRRHLVWDGRDTTGRRVAQGVYFYRMETRGFTETGKLLLLR